jgi:hypothetical protein
VRRCILAGFLLVSVLMVTRAAQSPSNDDDGKPVWTMEVLNVQPGMLSATLGYLDNDWMRVRAEAKRQGVVLNYYRIADQDSRENDHNIMLLTEFKNAAAYDAREKFFASRLPLKQPELFESVRKLLFEDYSDTNRERFKLLSKN